MIFNNFRHFEPLSSPNILYFVIGKWTTSVFTPKRFYSSEKNSFNQGLAELLASMPKVPKAANELRHFRIKNKAAASEKGRYLPANVTLTALGNGADGNPRCLYMFADNNRYMFNCGEGSQRLCHEHKMKLSKLEHIFFTYKSWRNIGGLSGLLLTLQDIGVPDITIHGPSGINQLFKMTKYFMNINYLKIVYKLPELKTYSDHCMKVDYVPITSNQKSSNILNRNLLEVVQRKDIEVEENDLKRIKLFEEPVSHISIAYICKLHDKPGQLQLDKCVDQGVPPGPLLGQLKNGNDVTLKCGRIVKALDVKSPDEPGPVFIVLECPDESFIPSLLKEEAFKKHQNSDDPTNLASTVVHFTSTKIMNHPLYKEWIQRFPSNTVHLCLNSDSPSLSSISIHKIQHKLNILDSEIFPLLTENSEKFEKNKDLQTVQADCLLRFGLRPPIGLDRSTIPVIDEESFSREIQELEHFDTILTEMRNNVQNITNFDQEYPEVVFLGTGSAIPSKARNVSSILVNIDEVTHFLMDCGEGTYRQILKLYGKSGTIEILQNLKCIFISHLHADHHLGLIQLLQEREAIFLELNIPCPVLTLIAPKPITEWLNGFHQTFEPISHLIRLVPNFLILFERKVISDEEYQQLLTLLNIKEIETVTVKHCHNAYGITFETNSGFKIVYSGDTMPCENLIRSGQNCSLLIHEATMEDDLIEDAIVKTHSTTSQAIEVGQRMNARFTVLTHFSQRYAKLPIYNENFRNNVAFAFDNMKIRPRHLPKLALMLPPLKCLFQEDYDEMLKRTDHRLQKKTLLEEMSNNR